ncbi:DUF3710 domain-containing protein [Streptomyces sp. NPDC049687]|uniref:DUF3710 domain-containing protein n=1 Tax=Streptomyces sp. NPDC049687 TaxID=3365596 RepID=UPI0037AE06A0
MRRKAREILARFRRDGFIAPESESAAEFGVWDRLTPGRVLLTALQLELNDRRTEGHSPERIATDLGFTPGPGPGAGVGSGPGLGHEEAAAVITGLLGDVAALRHADQQGRLALSGVLTLLRAVIEAEGYTESEIDELLGFAEEAARAALRGPVSGPWDAGSPGVPEGEYTDLGGLRIPAQPGNELKFVGDRSGDGGVLAVTVVHGRTALQLQAYHRTPGRSWDTVRADLLAKLSRDGASVREWAGPAGVELRAEVPVVRRDGSHATMHSRFLGFDGPGWLLRGVVTGAGAAPDSTDDWPYEFFGNTVVVPEFAGPADSGPAERNAIPLRIP